jgi:DNA-binding IclR family transcriptional regulator
MRHRPLVTGTGGRRRFAAVRGGPDSDPDRQARDESIERLRHSDYLTTELDHETEVQVMQVSAPVFDAYGAVTASLMMARDLRLCDPARCDVVSLRRATSTSTGSGHGWGGRR